MADVGWISLSMRPWDDSWLEEDTELGKTFHELYLTNGSYRGGDGTKLAGAMNGDREDNPEKREIVLSGEMRGGSWEIKESNLLELLRDRGIAYILHGDAKYEWDGDEEWWHPGMEAPFVAVSGSEDRMLDRPTFDGFMNDAVVGTTGYGHLAEKIIEFFSANPYAWNPDPDYTPNLKAE